jgi:hypothetical protein
MFAHKLSMYLKNDGALAFKRKMESDIIPLLRKQSGFLEQITLLYLNGREVHAFSLWKSAEHAEAYNRGAYPEVARMLSTVIEGIPRIQTYEVLNSTIPQTLAAAPSSCPAQVPPGPISLAVPDKVSEGAKRQIRAPRL